MKSDENRSKKITEQQQPQRKRRRIAIKEETERWKSKEGNQKNNSEQ